MYTSHIQQFTMVKNKKSVSNYPINPAKLYQDGGGFGSLIFGYLLRFERMKPKCATITKTTTMH